MIKKLVSLGLIALTLVTLYPKDINTYKTHDTKVLTLEDSIDSFKSQTTIKQIC
ncbi:hypothetical protein [Natronincola ferrireducens]|uniref:Uncharacterized protein n=1 Tax=Natronincola ferrireducens TaxID=393762 RepID=A0A1G8YJ73_9FIRM|nr:hypothetical protein [Natronincola ferrireducens]SDK02892.1 hypothetical protein SAMN05660472_00561 [Natronincola ferrireducens]